MIMPDLPKLSPKTLKNLPSKTTVAKALYEVDAVNGKPLGQMPSVEWRNKSGEQLRVVTMMENDLYKYSHAPPWTHARVAWRRVP